jgi:hypothetical protein
MPRLRTAILCALWLTPIAAGAFPPDVHVSEITDDFGGGTIGAAVIFNSTVTINSTLTLGGDVDMDHNDIIDVDYIYHQATASDVAPHDTTIKGANAYSQAATNTGGGDLYIGGGLGTVKITCVQATATGTTLTFNSTPSVLNVTITEGVEWDCLVDDNTCATALETYIDTTYSAAFTATAVANVVWLEPVYTTKNLKVTSADGGGGGTKFAVVDGVEGQILTPDGTAAVPTISFTSDPDSGFYPIAANQVGMAVGGSWHTTFRASGLWTVADVRAGAGGKFHGVDSTEISFPTDGDVLITNDAETPGMRIRTSGGLWLVSPTTDVDPDDLLIKAPDSYSQGAQTAANLVLTGGLDEKYFTSTDYANSTNDTFAVAVGSCTAGVCSVTTTTLTESTSWDCDVTSDIVCACALYDALIASPITGVTAGRTDGTCSDAKVFFVPTDGTTYFLTLTATDAGGGGVGFTATNGTDGVVQLGGQRTCFGGVTTDDWCLKTDVGYALFREGDDSDYIDIFAKSFSASGNGFIAPTGGYMRWNAQTRLSTGNVDGDLEISNNAETSGATLVASAADTLTLETLASGDGATFDIGAGHLQFGNAARRISASGANVKIESGQLFLVEQTVDNAVDGSAMFTLYSSASDEMTASSGTQYGVEVLPELEQSGTAAFVANFTNVTDTASGSGQDYLEMRQWGGTTVYSQEDDGSVDVYDASGNGIHWREFHLGATKTDPGGSGATLTVVNTASFVYLLDATTEYLYFETDIHDDWDGSSDIVVEVQVALSGAETANDVIQGEIVAEYYGEHDDMDTGIKTQTRTVNHDIVSDNGQGDVHHLVFIIDEDLASHNVDPEDNIKLRFRLDSVAGGTDVAAVWFIGANVKYRTSKPQLETGGTFPSEG